MQLPDENSVEICGNTVIFSGKYGMMGPDGEMHSVAVAPYTDTRRFNRKSGVPGMQAHHVAQNAIYGKIIRKADGIAVSLFGSALTDWGSPHNKAHVCGEQQLDTYRKSGTSPTNNTMYEIYARELQAAGLDQTVIEYVLYRTIQQQMEHGLLPDMPIPRMPRKIYFGKSRGGMYHEKVSEEQRERI